MHPRLKKAIVAFAFEQCIAQEQDSITFEDLERFGGFLAGGTSGEYADEETDYDSDAAGEGTHGAQITQLTLFGNTTFAEL